MPLVRYQMCSLLEDPYEDTRPGVARYRELPGELGYSDGLTTLLREALRVDPAARRTNHNGALYVTLLAASMGQGYRDRRGAVEAPRRPRQGSHHRRAQRHSATLKVAARLALRGAVGGDNDGRINMREFLRWYARGLKVKRDIAKEDVQDVFQAIAVPGAAAAAASPGSPPAPTSISKAQLAEFLKESFELEVDIDEVLGGPGSTIDVASFEALCLKKD